MSLIVTKPAKALQRREDQSDQCFCSAVNGKLGPKFSHADSKDPELKQQGQRQLG